MATKPKAPRPPSDRGQGRKPTSPSGEAMAARKIRMTDSDWKDAKLIGAEALRKWIRRTAAKLRAKALSVRKAAPPRTKPQLIDFLASRRQELGGSISEHNHRRLLATRTKADLLTQYKRILENERRA